MIGFAVLTLELSFVFNAVFCVVLSANSLAYKVALEVLNAEIAEFAVALFVIKAAILFVFVTFDVNNPVIFVQIEELSWVVNTAFPD